MAKRSVLCKRRSYPTIEECELGAACLTRLHHLIRHPVIGQVTGQHHREPSAPAIRHVDTSRNAHEQERRRQIEPAATANVAAAVGATDIAIATEQLQQQQPVRDHLDEGASRDEEGVDIALGSRCRSMVVRHHDLREFDIP